MTIAKLAAASALMALVAACSDGGGSSAAPPAPTPFDALVARVTAGADLAAEVSALSNTAFGAMPASGSVSFAGYGALIIENAEATEDDDILVVGDAVMTADFDDNTMTGVVDNLAAALVTGTDVLDISGGIAIGGGQSFLGDDFDDNLTDRPNQWYADYAGDLTIEGDLYEVEGAFVGDFVGTRVDPGDGVSPIVAVSAMDEDGFAVVNGAFEEVGLVFEIVAEN